MGVFETASPWKSVILYVKVYTAIFSAIIIGLYVQNPMVMLLTVIFIAVRQHSLYILSHDASHYSLFKSRRVNKMVATIFSNLVMFHHPEAWSFIQWRRVHLQTEKLNGHLADLSE